MCFHLSDFQVALQFVFTVLPRHVASGAVTVLQARAAAAESCFMTLLKGKVARSLRRLGVVRGWR